MAKESVKPQGSITCVQGLIEHDIYLRVEHFFFEPILLSRSHEILVCAVEQQEYFIHHDDLLAMESAVVLQRIHQGVVHEFEYVEHVAGCILLVEFVAAFLTESPTVV